MWTRKAIAWNWRLHKIEKGCNHDTIAALDLFKLVPKKRLELSLGNPN
jgi:hypothetical protein